MTSKPDLRDYARLYLEPTCGTCKRDAHDRHWSFMEFPVKCGRCGKSPVRYDAWAPPEPPEPPVPRKKPAPSELMKELSAAASAISKLRHKISVLEEEPEAEA